MRTELDLVMSAPGGLALWAMPDEGIVPLTVRFTITGLTPVRVALDFDGDGETEFVGPSLEGNTFTYGQPGVYFPTAVVTDAQGFRFTLKSLVRVTAGRA
jgi:PKD repeat protein